MERVAVKSSNVAEVGYDPESQTLEIAFRNGNVYAYFGVPMHRYVGLVTADSKGRYFHRMIRQGAYPFKKVYEEV